MSLQDIFNPVVRTYFKNKYGESGASTTLVYDYSKNYPTYAEGLYKISDKVPEIEDLECIFIAAESKGNIIARQLAYESGNMGEIVLGIQNESQFDAVAAIISKETAELLEQPELEGVHIVPFSIEYNKLLLVFGPIIDLSAFYK